MTLSFFVGSFSPRWGEKEPTKGKKSVTLNSFLPTDIGRDHLLPERPIVRPAIPPAHGVPDILAPERVGKVAVGLRGAILTPDRHDNFKAANIVQQLPILEAAHNIERIVIMNLFIMVAIEKTMNIVVARKTQHTPERRWVT